MGFTEALVILIPIAIIGIAILEWIFRKLVFINWITWAVVSVLLLLGNIVPVFYGYGHSGKNPPLLIAMTLALLLGMHCSQLSVSAYRRSKQ